MKIAVVGATGMVGRIMLNVLEERNIPVSELIPAASKKSIGKKIIFKNQDYTIVSIEEAIKRKPQIAIFSAGASVSIKYAQKFAENGSFVIDNSSAWRMHKEIPLIVPEINANLLTKNDKIIANPNCSTIQLVMALNPLHKKYGIKRIVVSTYQSVTGSGMAALKQLENEENGIKGEMKYPYPIYRNALPHCDIFLENAYTKEEMKLVNETQKILNDYEIGITATAVRVPVTGGHSESVNLELKNNFEIDDIIKILSETQGVIVQDDIKNNVYPMAIFAEGKDEVFVGRIRKDYSQKNTLNMWIVADNLRKGAATNAVQIADYLIKNNFV